MTRHTELEIALQSRFADVYARSVQPVMLEIEHQVCGCKYGGNSWTTREQADALIESLGINETTALIDLGAGTGWPGLYLAQSSGCSVTLVDLPEIGLRIAQDRARADGIADRVSTRVADAAHVPFEDASFDIVSHSDLLCCLVSKRAVLLECRRIIRAHGQLAFTVISVSSDLSETEHARALANAPEFVETECRYQTLLEQTGWQVTGVRDLTDDYHRSCSRQIEADTAHHAEIAVLLGAEEASDRLSSWNSKLDAIRDGLFRRELFVCRPN